MKTSFNTFSNCELPTNQLIKVLGGTICPCPKGNKEENPNQEDPKNTEGND